jgi:hypothetical protein
VDATSTLSKYHGGWLDDDMLKGYDTVIHIPYNISTMSCFEQGSANIPMWIPTARLLKKILLEEYSELSWYCFGGDRSTAERPDQVWIEEVVEEYVKRADFYTGVFGCTLEFDSVEELQEKIHTIDYDALVKKSYAHIVKEKLEVAKGYLQVLPV